MTRRSGYLSLAAIGAVACGAVEVPDPMPQPNGAYCERDADCRSERCQDQRCAPTWPFGRDGDLWVTGGSTVQLAGDATWDFASLHVDAGGVLELLPSDGWTVIGCAGPIVLDGTFRARSGQRCDGAIAGQVPARDGSPTGRALSFDCVSASGGGGGASGLGAPLGPPGMMTATGGAPGGAAAFGNGGGGGGALPPDSQSGHDATASASGAGGAGTPGVGLYGRAGVDGSEYASLGGGTIWGGSAGGSGGSRGYRGQLLYIEAASLTGGGGIDASGSAGGHGGRGGDGGFQLGPSGPGGIGGGGGGGGGAGGGGGVVIIRTDTPVDPSLLARVDVSGGPGGAGGAAGVVARGDADAGAPGADGGDGAPGEVDAGPR